MSTGPQTLSFQHRFASGALCKLTVDLATVKAGEFQPRFIWSGRHVPETEIQSAIRDGARHAWQPDGHPRESPRSPQSKFEPEEFKAFIVGAVRIDSCWLAQRSPIDPGDQTPASFLRALYCEGEGVIIFDELRSPGRAIWWHIGLTCDAGALDRFAKGARSGVWFLANPVDGVWRPNREGKWSLRSQENVTAWRYMVVESDRGDISAGEWLAFLVALQLPIAAICETGGRLPHALLRVDAASKEGWDRIRDALAPLLIMGGADPDSLSAVRLTRLPCGERLGREDEAGGYHKFPDGPHLQRLLYLNPQPTCTPILRLGLRPATGASKT
jgi:hypothetical protein